jgi:hypothetical protein
MSKYLVIVDGEAMNIEAPTPEKAALFWLEQFNLNDDTVSTKTVDVTVKLTNFPWTLFGFKVRATVSYTIESAR